MTWPDYNPLSLISGQQYRGLTDSRGEGIASWHPSTSYQVSPWAWSSFSPFPTARKYMRETQKRIKEGNSLLEVGGQGRSQDHLQMENVKNHGSVWIAVPAAIHRAPTLYQALWKSTSRALFLIFPRLYSICLIFFQLHSRSATRVTFTSQGQYLGTFLVSHLGGCYCI